MVRRKNNSCSEVPGLLFHKRRRICRTLKSLRKDDISRTDGDLFDIFDFLDEVSLHKISADEVLVIEWNPEYDLKKYFTGLRYKTLSEMEQIITNSPSNFYYFCWRGAYDDDEIDMGEMPLSDYKKSKPLFQATKTLNELFDLMDHPHIRIGEFKHFSDKEIFPHTFKLSSVGKNVYKELKNKGFIKFLKKTTEKNPFCFRSKEKFALWFFKTFYFEETEDNDVYDKIVSDLKKQLNIFIPKNCIFLNDNEGNEVKVLHEFSDSNPPELVRSKVIFECGECGKKEVLDYGFKTFLHHIVEGHFFEQQHLHERFIKLFKVDPNFWKLVVSKKRLKQPKINKMDDEVISYRKVRNKIKFPEKITIKEVLLHLTGDYVLFSRIRMKLPTLKIVSDKIDHLPEKDELMKPYIKSLKKALMMLKTKELVEFRKKKGKVEIRLTKKGALFKNNKL